MCAAPRDEHSNKRAPSSLPRRHLPATLSHNSQLKTQPNTPPPKKHKLKLNQKGWLHPTINLENPDVGVDTKLVCANEKVQHKVNVALSNSFGFGGHNSCVLFSAPP